MLTYKEMLEGQKYRVCKIQVLAISKLKNGSLQWNASDVKPTVKIIDELEKLMPLKVKPDGLSARKSKFCPVCEYKSMCGKR